MGIVEFQPQMSENQWRVESMNDQERDFRMMIS